MASVAEFRCEVCGMVSAYPIHWLVIRCSITELTVIKWNAEAASAEGARHYCERGTCASVYQSLAGSGVSASETRLYGNR